MSASKAERDRVGDVVDSEGDDDGDSEDDEERRKDGRLARTSTDRPLYRPTDARRYAAYVSHLSQVQPISKFRLCAKPSSSVLPPCPSSPLRRSGPPQTPLGPQNCPQRHMSSPLRPCHRSTRLLLQHRQIRSTSSTGNASGTSSHCRAMRTPSQRSDLCRTSLMRSATLSSLQARTVRSKYGMSAPDLLHSDVSLCSVCLSRDVPTTQ